MLTFADLRPLLDVRPHPAGAALRRDPLSMSTRIVLAKDEVTYVGEPVAMVVADSRRVAEDALALIVLDLEPLPAVTDPFAGLEPGAPKARMDCPDNLVARQSIDYGDVDGAFANAAHRIKARFRLHKGGGHSIETRGDRGAARSGRRHARRSTPTPRCRIAPSKSWSARSASPSRRIRVVAPDTGGGFGPKAAFHPEELALPAAALLLRRPLKWMEDRRENFVADRRRARPGLGHGDGGRCRRPHARIARAALPRPRLLHALRRGARLQRRHQRDRPLRAAGLPPRHQLVPDQLRAVRADARRRPPAGHVRDGAAARRRRGKARPRARRGAPPQHDPAVADAVSDADQAARRLDHDLRQRRLSGVPAPRA